MALNTMSKNNKKVNPKAAYSQTLTSEQKLNYERSLVIGNDGLTYLFSNPAATVAIVNPAKVYDNFKAFTASTDAVEVTKLHSLAFGGEAHTKADEADLLEWQVKVWMQLCKTANNRLASPAASGTRKVSEKMLNRSYELIKSEIPADQKMPPQVRTCLTFFTECAAADETYSKTPVEERGVYTISEKAFQAYVEKEQLRLKTRQNPWRIFQYYRPELIKGGYIRLI
jgi:hypothetical protein